jgi:hypothetical protein
MKHIVPLVALALLSGCATQETVDTDVETDAVTGAKIRRERIHLPQNVACTDFAQLSNTRPPTEIYAGLVRCIQEDRLNIAVRYFSLAGTYTAYDTYRVTDPEAHKLHAKLPLRVRELVGEKKWREFWATTTTTLSTPESLAEVCEDVRKMAPPAYAPRYMSKTAPVQDVTDTAPALYQRARERYLHCPQG